MRTRLAKAMAAVLASALLALALVACSAEAPSEKNASDQSAAEASSEAAESQTTGAEDLEPIDGLRVVSLKGPTSVGLAYLMESTQAEFKVVPQADEAAALLTQGSVDIACIPANLAATLYERTGGKVRVIDVNTLGVLNLVTANESIQSIPDLKGKTVYMTGKGTVPQYTLDALLESYGIAPDEVNVEYRTEPQEVVAAICQDAEAVGILPQPYATAAAMKDCSLNISVDLTQAWERSPGHQGSQLITGVTVAMASFIDENKDLVDAFLADCKASSDVVADDPKALAETVARLGIIDDAALAEAALPECSVVCITGEPMKEALSGYLEMLYGQNPESIGGSMPEDDFYYIP